MFHEKTICHGKFPKSNKFIRIYKKCRIHLLAVNLSLGRWFSRQQILSFSSVDIDMYHWIMFQTTFSKKLFKSVFSPGLTFFITATSTSYWWTLVCLDFSIVIYRFLLISCQCYWHCYNQKQSSESFLRKRCARVSFLMKLHILSAQLYQKRDFGTDGQSYQKVSNFGAAKLIKSTYTFHEMKIA